ncbi:MAG: hypothetical protein ABI833_15595, partial [Acidobacteriota bacterium]
KRRAAAAGVETNDTLIASDILEAAIMLSIQLLDCRNLVPGSLIDVETKSRHYRIEYLGGNSIRVSGHPEFCPRPVMASLQGSLDLDGTLEAGFIACGMRMIFLLDDVHPITTSRVMHVRVEEPGRVQ